MAAPTPTRERPCSRATAAAGPPDCYADASARENLISSERPTATPRKPGARRTPVSQPIQSDDGRAYHSPPPDRGREDHIPTTVGHHDQPTSQCAVARIKA